MRYLISKSFIDSTPARQDYLFDTVHLWTRRLTCDNDFLTLESMPSCSLDVLFIVGHNKEVNFYLTKHRALVHEKTVVIITCGHKVDLTAIKNMYKSVYISRQNQDHQSLLLIGEKFGFDFDLTESELIFFNNRHLPDIPIRLEQAFTKIK